MSKGIGKEELIGILANSPRLVEVIRRHEMAGFLSKDELTGMVAGSVQTADLADGAITKAKLGYKRVAVTVAAGATSGSSPADSELVDGEIIGYYSTGNQDQLVDNVALGADGSVTVTLAAAATADNTFNVLVAKP